jgi:hypothetical protein
MAGCELSHTKQKGAEVNTTTPWVRNCEAAEELEELFEQIIARGMPALGEVSLMRQRLRRNTQNQVEALHVVSLTASYLKGGEAARRKRSSETSRKDRRHAQAGIRTLPNEGLGPEEDGLDDDVA